MFDQEASQRAFNDVHRLFVEPELQRRRERGTLPENFRIHRCLILLPADAQPIVTFNEEIGWEGRVRLGTPFVAKEGDPVFLAQVAGVDTVKPPKVDGKRVACIFLYRVGNRWALAWDATPNMPPGYGVAVESDDEWSLGKAVAESINADLAQRALAFHASAESETLKVGLWAAPALLPYPLAAIAERCKAGDLEAARTLLVTHCAPKLLATLVDEWSSDPVFQVRDQLFREALWAHREGKYALSVSTLMPHVEGVITDWMHGQSADVPWRHESKVKKLRDTLQQRGQLLGSDAEVARSVIGFMTGGPMLQTFDDWVGASAGPFPNRHAVGHGRFDSSHFTVESSVKVFLLLDTLHHLFNLREQQ